MYVLAEYLLYDEHISFLITVPVHEKLRNVLSLLTVYAGFLASYHGAHRMCFDLLHRMSTLHILFEDNNRNKKMYEYNCPRKYNFTEAFSHFSFGWADGKPGYDDEVPSAPNNCVKKSHNIVDDSGSNRLNAEISEESNQVPFQQEDDRRNVMSAHELRIRARSNMFVERERVVDAKNTNQYVSPLSINRKVQNIRFIPKRPSN